VQPVTVQTLHNKSLVNFLLGFPVKVEEEEQPPMPVQAEEDTEVVVAVVAVVAKRSMVETVEQAETVIV
jgi:hypothetical protein